VSLVYVIHTTIRARGGSEEGNGYREIDGNLDKDIKGNDVLRTNFDVFL